MTSLMRRLALAACLSLLASCAMHSRATHWNNHVGPDGEPVFVLQSTFVGLHLAALVPFVGSTTIDDMLDESTAWIDAHEGTHLRLVETESSNYWYGAPPLSWLFSPVVTSVSIEYRPSRQALAREGVVVAGEVPAEPAR